MQNRSDELTRISELRLKKINELLSSYAKHGLLAKRDPYLSCSGRDDVDRDRVSVNVADFTDNPFGFYTEGGLVRASNEEAESFGLKNFNDPVYGLTCLVSSPESGMWSVTMERQFCTSFSKQELSERLCSNVVFILKPPKDLKYTEKDAPRHTVGNTTLVGGQGRAIYDVAQATHPFTYELKTTKKFSCDDILAVLCPRNMLELVRPHFRGKKIFSPIDLDLTIELPALVKLTMAKCPDQIQLRCPHYVDALQEFIKLTGNKKFAVHIARLPTERDINILEQRQRYPITIASDRKKMNLVNRYAGHVERLPGQAYDHLCIHPVQLMGVSKGGIREELGLIKKAGTNLKSEQIAALRRLTPPVILEPDPHNAKRMFMTYLHDVEDEVNQIVLNWQSYQAEKGAVLN